MEDTIIFVSIFVCVFIIVCVVFDCTMRSRMKRRLRETWAFIHSMKDFVEPKIELPERVPF